jgi:Mn-dependent DtxR family transcriptional regulator
MSCYLAADPNYPTLMQELSILHKLGLVIANPNDLVYLTEKGEQALWEWANYWEDQIKKQEAK